jgi:membrane fusion protein (multidrug efflux system)
MTRRRIILSALVLSGVLLLVWGGRKWAYASAHQSTDNAQVDGHIVPVLAKVGGYVRSVAVGENQRVAAGTLLVQIDEAEYRQRLGQADADLAAAHATAGANGSSGQARAQVMTASGQRSALEAQIRAARATADRATADLQRAEGLAKQQIIPRAQLDAARSVSAAADASVAALERQAAAAGATVVNAEAGVKVADARVKAAEAARGLAALQLEYTRAVTPVSGIVSRKQVEVGQLVQAGQPLLWVVADSGTWITANFKETQLSHMAVGQPVEVDVDAYEECTVQGSVESISFATGAKFALIPPDNATGNFTKVVQRVPVRIKIVRECGADRPLRPGMSVTVHVNTG